MENCAMVWVPRKAWNDLNCEAFCYGFCHINARPETKMRGVLLEKLHKYLSLKWYIFIEQDLEKTWLLIDSIQCQLRS